MAANSFWTVVWFATALAVLVVLGVLFVYWPRRRGPVQAPGMPLYLHEDRVIAIYQVGGYGDALVREVQERVTVTKDGKMQIAGQLIALGGGGSVERQIVNTYVKHADPIEVVGVVLKALDTSEGIVHVNLIDRRIRGSSAWRRSRANRLSGVRGDVYVSVFGEFELVPDSGGRTVFLAAIGDTEARVRVECTNAGLQLKDGEEVPEEPFYGHCLGKVQPWQADEKELRILPVAIFR